MDEQTRKRMFDPYFSTKLVGRGLGMAAVYGIIKKYAGWIVADLELGSGTLVKHKFEIMLPFWITDQKNNKRFFW